MYGVELLNTVQCWSGIHQSAMFLITWLWFSFINQFTTDWLHEPRDHVVTSSFKPASLNPKTASWVTLVSPIVSIAESYKDLHCISHSSGNQSQCCMLTLWCRLFEQRAWGNLAILFAYPRLMSPPGSIKYRILGFFNWEKCCVQ